MTTPRAADVGGASRPSPWLRFVPVAIIAAAAALTPAYDLHLHQSDVALYFEKAHAVASGLAPYRDVPLEYPPLALVPMVVPYVVGLPVGVWVEGYAWLFAAWQAVLVIAMGLVLDRLVRLGADGGAEADAAAEADEAAGSGLQGLDARLRGVRIRFGLLCLGAALAITWRFDLLPALLVMTALWAVLAGRPGAAGVVIGLGVLAKLYPVAVLPALAVPWLFPPAPGRLLRLGLATGVTVAAGFLPFFALAGDRAFQFLAYHADRGLQVESVGGGLALLAGLVSGQRVPISFEFVSAQADGAFAEAWLRVLPAATVVALGLLGVLGWLRARRERAAEGKVQPVTVVTLAFACVLVLLATSKVFSIQYVVWVLPFMALLRGGRFRLSAAVIALTMPIHPLLYGELVGQQALPILLLNLRNALFLALTAWALVDLARRPGAAAGAAAGRPVRPT